LWVVVTWPGGVRALLRTAYAPGGTLQVRQVDVEDANVSLVAESAAARFDVSLELVDAEEPIVHARTVLTPHATMSISSWPRDLLILGPRERTSVAKGAVEIASSGLSASIVQLALGQSGSAFYFQNLTALADYAQQSGVSLAGTVGGQWPELGFGLPPSKSGKSLPRGRSVVIADAFVRASAKVSKNHFQIARQFLNNLGAIYLSLERPETTYRDWPMVAERVVDDLDECVGCWTYLAGKKYVNAYLSDYSTPPELMVQLAVLMPLLDYARYTTSEPATIVPIRSTLDTFFDTELHIVRRWLPARDSQLDGDEEQKKPNVMDSWYVHHTLLNLGRLAAQGDRGAKKLFFASLEYLISAARKFKYDWPIFFDIATLDVIKAESEPGAGGEKDVPGLYAHVMLQAWDQSGEQRYLDEAARAGRALANRGFEIFYQGNVTTFGAYACFRLWKITGKKRFLDTSYLCLANVFANMWLWNCDYGYGRNYKTFMAAIPVKDAPYVASYEEQEVCATFATLLSESTPDDDLSQSATLLMSEYVRLLADRAWFSYPTNLPADAIAERPKTGELARQLWIPLEDIQDGWEQSGAVGQEVYGAGLAFGVVTRHYRQIDDGEWTLYTESLIRGPERARGNTLTFTVLGDEHVTSRVRIFGKGRPADIVARTSLGNSKLTSAITPEEHLEYIVRGGDEITLTWSA
jgi:hypothetical protein